MSLASVGQARTRSDQLSLDSLTQAASRHWRFRDYADTLIHADCLLPSRRVLGSLQVVNQQSLRCHDGQFNADLHQDRT